MTCGSFFALCAKKNTEYRRQIGFVLGLFFCRASGINFCISLYCMDLCSFLTFEEIGFELGLNWLKLGLFGFEFDFCQTG